MGYLLLPWDPGMASSDQCEMVGKLNHLPNRQYNQYELEMI